MQNYSNADYINSLKKWGAIPKKGNDVTLFWPLFWGITAGAICMGYYLNKKHKNKILALTDNLKEVRNEMVKMQDQIIILSAIKENEEKISSENENK